MPKSRNICVLMELCEWGYIGRSKRRKLQFPSSLRICLLLLPFQVTYWQILHSTKDKKDTFFNPGRSKIRFPWLLGQGCPVAEKLHPRGAALADCRETRRRSSKRKYPSPGLNAIQCWGCQRGTFGLRWEVQHRILPIQGSNRECERLGAEVTCLLKMLLSFQDVVQGMENGI